MSIYSLRNIFSEIRLSLKLATPIIISEFIFGLSGFLSTMMVAHLGREELAANALAWSTFVALILFFIGILSATGVLVAQSYGAKDNHAIQVATKQGVILGVIFALPMILAVLVAPYILMLTGQDPEIIKIATPLFHALAWGMLPLNLLIVMEQFLLGIAKTRLVLLISTISVPLQLIFMYVLVFGKYGMPNFGIAGVGYGLALSYSITAILIGFYIHKSKHSRSYHIFANNWSINKKFLNEIVRFGLPLGAMFCSELALFAAIVIMMGKLGADTLAAHQIAFQCVNFAITVIFALSQSTSIRIGHEVGRNNREGLLLTGYINIGIGICWMLLVALVYVFFPEKIIALDLSVHAAKYQKLVQLAIHFLTLAAILQLTDCILLITNAALRGLKDTKVSFFISVICFWLIAFPCSYILGFKMHFAGVGIWWGCIIGLAINATILLVRFNYLAKKVDLQALVTTA